MRRNNNQVIKVFSMALVATMLLAGCGKSNTTSSGNNGDNASDMKATITVGYTADYKSEFTQIIAAFNEKYPDIEVIPQEIAGTGKGQITKMNALAATGKLPDVCTGSEELGYIVQQGWAYPLDNLLENDPDRDYVLEMGLDNFTYGDHIYALPHKLQFATLVVNTDLLEQLNMDIPEYDWTLEEMISLAKKATTAQYSGINYIYNAKNPTWGFDTKLMSGLLPEGYGMFGYDFENRTIDITANDAWVKSNNILKDLFSTPGLIADELRKTSNNGISEYEKKFGSDSDALVAGKVLIGNSSTWEYNGYAEVGFNYDFYPFPTTETLDSTIQTHVDFAYMTTNCTEDNYQAAYEFLKFFTYSKEGALIQLNEAVKKYNENMGGFQIFIPASEDPEVLEAFDKTPYAEGIKYMLRTVVENPECAHIADTDKLVPNFWNDVQQYKETATENVQNGADPTALVADLQNKMSAAVDSTWAFFESSLEKNMKEFYETHPYEKQ